MTDDAPADATPPAAPRRRWVPWAVVAGMCAVVWLFVGLTPIVTAGDLHGAVPVDEADGPVSSVWVQLHNGTMTDVTVTAGDDATPRQVDVRLRPLSVDATGALAGVVGSGADTVRIPAGGDVALEVVFPDGCPGLPAGPVDGAPSDAIGRIALHVRTLGLPRTVTVDLPAAYEAHFAQDRSLPCA